MGTRSLTHIKQDGKTLVTIYRQYDGYPEGLGKELYDFLKDFTVLNGYGKKEPKLANGIGCLAAQVVDQLKDGIGNVYLYPPDSSDCGEEYVYTIYLLDDKIHLKLTDDSGETVFFDGPVTGYEAWLTNQQ